MGLDTLSQKNTAENGAPTTVEAGAICAHGSSHTSTSASKLQSVSEGPAYSVPDFLAIAGATANQNVQEDSQVLAKARIFAERLLEFETLDSGENSLAHADAVAAIVKQIGGSESLQAASYLVYASAFLSKPAEMIGKVFG